MQGTVTASLVKDEGGMEGGTNGKERGGRKGERMNGKEGRGEGERWKEGGGEVVETGRKGRKDVSNMVCSHRTHFPSDSSSLSLLLCSLSSSGDI